VTILTTISSFINIQNHLYVVNNATIDKSHTFYSTNKSGIITLLWDDSNIVYLIKNKIHKLNCNISSILKSDCEILSQINVHKQLNIQIIIKFIPKVVDPSHADYVETLARDAGVKLVYFRAMSGGAHIFRIENLVNRDQLSMILYRLSKRSDVMYVEEDRVMEPQTD
jgi:hypothetical protein